MMITIEKEEKIRKGIGVMMLFSMPFFTSVIKDDVLKLWILIPLILVMFGLTFRKFIRDRREGKSLTRYYIAFGFIMLAIVMNYCFYLETV